MEVDQPAPDRTCVVVAFGRAVILGTRGDHL